MSDKPIDILIITAHPDDAEFGVAGSVAKWTAEGQRVVYVVCTCGERPATLQARVTRALPKLRDCLADRGVEA